MNPSIHIWDSNTLKNLGVIKGCIKGGIYNMAFF